MMTKEEAMEKFKALCVKEYAEADEDNKLDASEEQDWFSLSLGFFAALGFEAEDCHELALVARYDNQYWCGTQPAR